MINGTASITLSDGTTTVQIPDLTWTDELQWSPVRQEVHTGLTGKPIIYNSPLSAGRPITLEHKNRTLMRRSRYAALQAMAAVPNAVLTLTVRGTPYTVQVHHAAGGFSAEAALDYSQISGDNPVWATLRFITVES